MTEESNARKLLRLEFARSFGAMMVAQLVFTGLSTHFVAMNQRPLVMFGATALSMLILAVVLDGSRKLICAAIVLSTLISVVCIYEWRQLGNSLEFIGAVPASLEIPALAVSATLTILLGTFVAMLSRPNGRAYRFRWAVVILLSVLVVAGLWALSKGSRPGSMAMCLQHVVQLEAKLDESRRFERQDLSFWLGAFGRSAEAISFSTRNAEAHGHVALPTKFAAEIETEIASTAVGWRRAISEIAATERLVIIMEAHNATQHREWIEQTFPIFFEAGFRRYAAETLSEGGAALKQRGYPVHATGAYVADPRFGNLLRRALEFDYTIHEYEAIFASDMTQREEQQAQALTNIIAANPNCKMVIHAGYSHVFKQPVPNSGKRMAARLWEKTGIEPYCIYQGYEDYDSPNYSRLVELAGATDEPKLLMPPPSGLTDPQFADIPAGAVDALVIHPLAKGEPPDSRRPVFSSGMTQLRGRWLENERPIVVGAYRVGETTDAIALDQVMLRHGESEFELWIPEGPHVLRVTSTAGVIKIDVEQEQAEIQLRRAGVQ